MRLIFVNHAHPDIPHVSGMRLAYFAKALAQCGHHVVLITSTLPEQAESSQGPGDLVERMNTHDWSEPFHLEVQPIPRKALDWVRTNRVPAPLRRTLTFWYMAYHGGVFEDWVAACRPYARVLAQAFRPALAWGTFGNTSNLVLTQYIARQAGCPWLMDIKDNWSTFLKPGLREWLAWRFRDARGYTSNATHHQDIVARWLRQRKSKVIYSGVAEPFLCAMAQDTERATRDLILIGGTYDQTVLCGFLQGLKAWLQDLASVDLAKIRFLYVGSDSQRVSAALERVNLPCTTHVPGYLSILDLARECRNALANCYLWAPFTFHHKLLELLSCGRPIIVYPGEAPESKALAAQTDTPFAACPDESSLHAAFTQAWNIYGSKPNQTPSQQWRWSVMSEQLEAFFTAILQEKTP